MEKDLSKIAEQMINWEQFAPHLRLTEVDINDIKKTHQNDPLLQRYVHIIMLFGFLLHLFKKYLILTRVP